MTSIKLQAMAACAIGIFGLLSSSIGTQAQVVTSTVNLTCSSTKKLQAAINSAAAGVVTTINISNQCKENIVIPAGKTIVLNGSNTGKIVPADISNSAIISYGNTTLQRITVSNASGVTEDLVKIRSGRLDITASDLYAPNTNQVLAVIEGSYARVINTRISGGKESAIDIWANSTVTLIGDYSSPSTGPSKSETLVSSTATGNAVGCGPGSTLIGRVYNDTNGNGAVKIQNSKNGIGGSGCDINLRGLVVDNNTDNGIFLVNGSLVVDQSTIANSGACGLNLQNSTAQLALGAITSSGKSQSWGGGICTDGGHATINGGISFSNNVGGDVRAYWEGPIVFHSWNGASSLSDAAAGNSLQCGAGGNIYVDSGSVSQDLTAYADNPCVSLPQ